MEYTSQYKQLSLETFRSSLESLPKDNRWVQLGDQLPWDKIERIYNARLNNEYRGAGNKPARLIIGAVIIKHKMNLSDEETIETIRENPYMQYMLGLSEFTDLPVFDPSLFVTIRKRLGSNDFNNMSEELLKTQIAQQEKQQEAQQETKKDNENGTDSKSSDLADKEIKSPNKGLLKVDATCADAEVRYPTDLDLLHDGLRIMDRIIYMLYKCLKKAKPDTKYSESRSAYLNVIKLRSKPRKRVRQCKGVLLKSLYDNIMQAIEAIAKSTSDLFYKLRLYYQRLFITIIKMYHQQKEMYDARQHSCKDRIISIFQPHVRPIVRGKAKAKVEFGAKIGASIVDGYTFVDHHSWDAYNECEDLLVHLRKYKIRFGCLPAKFEGDKIYMNRRNRRILKFLGIEIGGKPLGRPSKEQDAKEYRKKMAKNIGERNEIEATFGTGKRVYRANNIRAKLPNTGESWTSMCYFAKNVMKFLRELLHVLFNILLLYRFFPQGIRFLRML